MRIALVDDQAEARALLRRRLESALNRRHVQAAYSEYETGDRFLADAREKRFTAVFMDIYMPGSNGIDTARALRAFDADCLLIFTTTSTDHALEGFQVRAMHYLVKPFPEAEIDRLAAEMLARIPRPDSFMDIRADGSPLRLAYQSIVWAEHFAHLIHIHTPAQKTLTTRMAFKDFIAPLKEDPRFFVCSRGVIVNLAHAVDFEEAAFRMGEGSRVFVSKELQKNARQAFMEFLLQKGR